MTKITIKPSQIDLSANLCSTLGMCEREQAACHLIRHLAEHENEKGKFWSFTFASLVDYYRRNGLDMTDMLYGLLGGWIDDYGLIDDPHYIVNWGAQLSCTQDFILRFKDHYKA